LRLRQSVLMRCDIGRKPGAAGRFLLACARLAADGGGFAVGGGCCVGSEGTAVVVVGDGVFLGAGMSTMLRGAALVWAQHEVAT
jgi:hypothetical protein